MSSLNNDFWEEPWHVFCSKSKGMTTRFPLAPCSGEPLFGMRCRAVCLGPACHPLSRLSIGPAGEKHWKSLFSICSWHSSGCLFVCLFLWDYFKDLEVPTAPEAGPPCAARMFPLRQLRWQRMGKVRSPLSRCLTWMCCFCSSVS